MRRRKQSDVRPENVGRLFFKAGDEVPYRLEGCESEPSARMMSVVILDETKAITAPVSDFKDYRLIPESLVAIPEKPKPPRADKGKTHKKAEKAVDVAALDTEENG